MTLAKFLADDVQITPYNPVVGVVDDETSVLVPLEYFL